MVSHEVLIKSIDEKPGLQYFMVGYNQESKTFLRWHKTLSVGSKIFILK